MKSVHDPNLPHVVRHSEVQRIPSRPRNPQEHVFGLSGPDCIISLTVLSTKFRDRLLEYCLALNIHVRVRSATEP